MLRFATTNDGKLREARAYLAEVAGPIEQFDYDYAEIQSDDLVEIAAHGAREAQAAADAPVIVDDSGLFVEPLGGFPGPYSSYVYDTLGIDRVSRLAREEPEPRAGFRAVVAYCDGDATTFAEMTTERKNALSHRGRALAKLAEWLADRE